MLSKVFKSKYHFILLLVLFVFMFGGISNAAEHENDEMQITEESTSLEQIQAKINDILVRYLGGKTTSEEEIYALVEKMDWETYQTARWEISELDNLAEINDLSERELMGLIEANTVVSLFSNALELKASQDPEVSLYTTVTVLDGKISMTDTANTVKVSGGTVTATAKGSLFSKKTNTITITNDTSDTIKLDFNYSVSSASNFTIDDVSSDTSGSYSKLLETGATAKFTITSNNGISNTTVTLTISDISLTVVPTSSDVTFIYDKGNVTVDGSTLSASGVTQSIGVEGAEINAIDGSFVGWINAEDNQLLSSSAKFVLKPAETMTVRAICTTEACFLVGKDYLFDNLKEAITYAINTGATQITLFNNGELYAGEYTIPSNITLLIPFDSVHTLYTTEPGDSTTYTKPSAYRVLTMKTGAHITVDGALSVSSKILAGSGGGATGGSPIGKCGWIDMEEGSTITVNTSGALYAYGYITGTGSVLAKGTGTSGATVYECFQLGEYRGGTQSTDMKNGVFAVAQYYVQNIEVPLTLEAGASEKAWSKVYVSIPLLGGVTSGSAVNFIGVSDSMFSLTSGSVTKKYDGNTDRLVIELNGSVNISSMEIKVSSASIDSARFVLSITNNITINVNENSTVNTTQDLAFLPGSEMNIEEGAVFTIGENKSIYVYDADQWEEFVYGEINLKNETDYWFIPIIYAPGQKYTRTKEDLKDALICVNGTIDASKGALYTTYGPMESMEDNPTILGAESSEGGANVYSKGGGKVILKNTSDTVTYRYKQIEKTYYKIPVSSAKLKNADGTFTLTSNSDIELNTYVYENGRWVCETHTNVNSEDYECDACGKGLAVELVGRTLEYVDKINVICLFEFLDQIELIQGVDENNNTCISNAGMVVWDSQENIAYGEDGSPSGYQQLISQLIQYPNNPDFYYAKAKGIETPNLHKKAYYSGYVKVGDKYYYSDVFEYGPSTYAYNMLEKETGTDADQTTPETKNLCITLLNYISAAQQYFPCADDDENTTVPEASALVNVALDEITTQKDVNSDKVLEDLRKYGTYDLVVPEIDPDTGAGDSIFKRVGKNLYFTDTVNLAAMFEFAQGTSWSESGAIFWTESQWKEMGENPAPNIYNYKPGTPESPLSKYNNSSTIYYAMCPISIAPKDMADTKIYSMGYVKVDDDYRYSSVEAYGIEDYIANIVADNAKEKDGSVGYYMKLLAQQLYHYERAAKAALLNQ